MRFELWLSALWLSVSVLLTPASSAEVRLNASSDMDQERQALVQLGNGSLALVFEDESVTGGRILLRRFTADLQALGPEQVVDLGIPGLERREPAICALTGGGFVVAYSATGPDADNYAVAYRVYDHNAQPLQPTESVANVNTAGPQFRPDVAGLTNGGFAICWVSPGGSAQDTFYRRFTAAGVAIDAVEIRANALGNDPVKAGDQANARIAALKDGGFVIVYEDRESGDVYGVRLDNAGQAMDAPGEAAGNKQFLLSASTAFEQTGPSVAALASGGFVVAYNSEQLGTAASRRVIARVFTANGIPGPEFLVGTHSNRWQDARLAGLANGNFAVIWQALVPEAGDSTVSSWAVFIQFFSATGAPAGVPVRVNTFDAGNQDTPSLATIQDNTVVAVWESFGQDSSGYGVFAQRRAALLPGVLTLQKISGVPSVAVKFAGAPYAEHELFASTNFSQWASLLVTNPASGSFEFRAPNDRPARTYRVQSR